MYNHEPEGYVCPFCELLKSDDREKTLSVNSDVVYQDEVVAALIGTRQWPNNPGNTLIIPMVHYENIYDLPVELATSVHWLAREIALAMKAVWQCDGISTRQHNEPAGNQDVWHYHLHVTPRYAGDELYASYGEGKLMPPEERAGYAADLREYLY